MLHENIKPIFEFYDTLLENLNFQVKKDDVLFNYIRWICNEAIKIIESDVEKAIQWIGFVQGVFYTKEIFTINQLRKHLEGVFE